MWRNEYLRIEFAVILFCWFFFSCSPKVTLDRIVDTNTLNQFAEQTGLSTDNACCSDPLNYVPKNSDLYPMRYIRINIHFMDDSTGTHNFGKADGIKYMKYLVSNANDRLTRNFKMNLPHENNTPAYHPKYQYRLCPNSDNAFYWHQDNRRAFFLNKGKDRNNYDRKVIDTYEIGADSILNVFVMPHHPDSLKTGRYKASRTGIALGTGVKIAGLVEDRDQPWKHATLLNHEIGHVFGLRHAWTRNDGCNDTPVHPNCWQSDNSEKCKEPVSNNMMDYNNSQMAISPCQLGIIHKSIGNLKSGTRSVVEPNWCNHLTDRYITVSKDTVWSGALDLNRSVLVKKGVQLTIMCRVSMPKGSKIIVEPGATLHLNNSRLHNDCGDNWEGVILESSAKAKGILRVTGNPKIENTNASIP